MRWERLFADLDAQLAAAEAAELAAEVSDRTRRERARLRLVDRLAVLEDAAVAVRLRGAGVVHGVVVTGGSDWLLLREPGGREALVPLGAVVSVGGVTARAAEPGSEGVVGARLDLRYALRGLVRDRAAVTVTLADGATLAGTLDAVGLDFVDVAEHAPAEPRRSGAVRRVTAVPLPALVLVRAG